MSMTKLIIAVIFLGTPVLLAGPITFTFSGTATGNLAGTSFTDASYVVTSSADTSQVVETFQPCMPTNPACPVFTLGAISSQIAIQGLPVATFSDATAWTDPNFSGDIIFDNSGLGILGITALFQGLETYDLQSSIGPIFSPVDFPSQFFSAFQNIPTSQGSLSLVAMNETFVAVAAPEPDTLLLLVFAISLIWVERKWHKSRSSPPPNCE
jgi:hypothetical protein